MKTLCHYGVLVPRKYESKALSMIINGKKFFLNNEQEEMAVAWVKKLSTDYVEDSTFVANFFQDFRKALGSEERVSSEEFDFSAVIGKVDREKAYKMSLTREEKKKLAAQRKAKRERNKEQYGFAVVDGESLS